MALLNEINVKGVPHPIVTDDGYYQEMTVGDAEQLVATTFTEDDAPYNFRTAGGAIDIGDRKQVEGLVGGSIVWNQIRNYIASESTSRGVTVVPHGEYVTVSGTGENNGEYITAGGSNGIPVMYNHVYLFDFTNDGYEPNKADMRAQFYNPAAPSGSQWTSKVLAGKNGGLIYKNDYVHSNDVKGFTKLSVWYFVATDYELSPSKATLNIYDITQMFGSTIADYIYALETANAGAGVAWFKKYFPKPYYAYNAGELMSVKALRHITRGFNAWDEEWEIGSINYQTGATQSENHQIRSKNFIPVLPRTTYYIKCNSNVIIVGYDEEQNYVKSVRYNTGNSTFTTSADNIHYIKFCTTGTPYYGDTYNHDICINLSWDGERDGEYEEYVEHVYELDPDLELRGIPQLSAGNDLYYDGDVYEPDGTVTRKYGVAVIDGSGSNYAAWPTPSDPYIGFAWYGIQPTLKDGRVYGMLVDQGFISEDGNLEARNVYAVSTVVYITIEKSALAGTNVSDFKDWLANHPITLVYPLATSTEESADPYNGTQIVDDFGTEEFIDAGVEAGTREVAIPVGHNSLYQPNLRAKLEMVPEAPEDEGYYVVYHHNGINEYVPLIIPQELPNLPSEDGTYTLKCTVASGSATLSFESEV